MLLWGRRRARGKSRGVTAFVDEGSDIEGKYTFTGTLLLNGKFKGEIVSADTLIVGEKAVINAVVHVGTALVSGEVVGTLVATERVELRKGARVFAEVEAPALVVEEGALLDGQCRMMQERPAEVAPGREASASVLSLKR